MPVKGKPLPSVEELKALFVYDSETGKFYHAVDKKRGSIKAGTEAGTLSKYNGYIFHNIDRKPVRAHRVAWKMHYGVDPEHDIDHINGNRSDNRIDNLRDVPRVKNARNRHVMNRNNKTGITGVCWKSDRKYFVANMPRGNRKQCPAFFRGTLLDCAAARISVENRLGMNQ